MAKSQKQGNSNTNLFLAALLVLGIGVGAFLVGPNLTGHVLASGTRSSDANYVEMYLSTNPDYTLATPVGDTGYSIKLISATINSRTPGASRCEFNVTSPAETNQVALTVGDPTQQSTAYQAAVNGFGLYYHLDQVSPDGTGRYSVCKISAFVGKITPATLRRG